MSSSSNRMQHLGRGSIRDCCSTPSLNITTAQRDLHYCQYATLTSRLESYVFWVNVQHNGLNVICVRGCSLFLCYLEWSLCVDCGRSQDALRAAQLCLQLLESTSRDELRRLLGFMAAAADNEAFRLHKQVIKSSVCINNRRRLIDWLIDCNHSL